MTTDRRQVAADYVAALTEREYAEFIAAAREHRAGRGEDAAVREWAAQLFRPEPDGWDMSTIFNTDTDK